MFGISESVLAAFALPLLALVCILCWFVVMVRGRRPLHITLKGFGVDINIRPADRSKSSERNNNERKSS